MLPQIMEKFLTSLEQGNINEKTIRAYSVNLRDFVDTMFNGEEPKLEVYEELDSEDFMFWLSQRQDKLSVSSLNQRIATLSKFYEYLLGRKIVSSNIPKTLGKIKEEELPQRAVLTEQEVVKFVGTASELAKESGKYADYRNEMVANLFLWTGLRIEELRNISVGDICIETGELTVIGKRGKKRTVCLPPKVRVMYGSYLKIRSLQKSKDDEALFLSRQASEDGYRLSLDQIRRVVVKLAKDARVKAITPHSLRHTCATLSIEKGADIKDVSKMLGHSTTAITEKIYVHQTNESASRVANVLDDII